MKKLLSLIVALFAILPIFAYDFEVDGIYYNKLSDNTVAVTYYGRNDYSGDVIIPETVTYNGVIYSVTEIGTSCFSGCSGLTSVTIGNSVTSIGDACFDGCSLMKDVTFEDGDATISLGYHSSWKGLFDDCPLENLYLGRNLSYDSSQRYGSSPFAFNKSLTSVTIGNSVTSLGDYCFRGCSGLTSVSFPNSVTSLGNACFNGCSSLKDVTFEDGEKTISLGYNSYYSWERLFDDCPLENLYLGRNLSYYSSKDYGYSPFYNNKSLTSVTIGNSVTSIGNYCFYGCSGLTSVSIPNSVTEIGSDCFNGCSGLTSISFPNSVTSLGNACFNGCSSLKDVTFEDGEKTISLGYNAIWKGLFDDCPLENLYLGRNLSYKSSEDYGYSPFARNKSLTSVTIGNSVTSIGNYCFYGCSGLTSVSIPNSVSSLGSSCFSYCSGLTTISIPNSVTSLSWSCFNGCSGLTSVSIPNSVISIGDYCFNGCSGLTSVSIPNSVTEIGRYAFYQCSGLTNLYIGEKVSKIGSSAFGGCKLIEEITVAAVVPPVVADRDPYEAFDSFAYTNATLCVPKESIEAYKTTQPWSKFLNIKTLDESGVNAVSENSEAVFDICSVNGVLLKRGATQADVDALAPGIYIAGGKKLLVK